MEPPNLENEVDLKVKQAQARQLLKEEREKKRIKRAMMKIPPDAWKKKQERMELYNLQKRFT